MMAVFSVKESRSFSTTELGLKIDKLISMYTTGYMQDKTTAHKNNTAEPHSGPAGGSIVSLFTTVDRARYNTKRSGRPHTPGRFQRSGASLPRG